MAGSSGSGAFQRGKIVPLEGSATPVEFMYNPETISLSKAVKWTNTRKPTSNSPDTDFAGGESGTFEISEIVLDETLPPPGGSSVTIGTAVTNLLNLMDIDNSLQPPRPPKCQFQWGSFRSFDVYVEKVSVKYELFDREGKPIRARVNVTFKQAVDQADIPAQNPTSRSGARKMHTVVEGETLDWIAYREFGDPAAWRHIAETNDLADPLNIRPGTVLRLVPPGHR